MQLMCDAISVLGSRHGLLMDPIAKRCGIIRFDTFEHLPELHVRAGVRIAGRELLLPLCPEGGSFRFHDQRLTPCSMSLMGIDAASGVKLKLTIVTPFRPRDPVLSTTPVLGLRLEAEKIAGNFRWERQEFDPDDVEVFVELDGPDITVAESADDALDLLFASVRSSTEEEGCTRSSPHVESLPQRDRVVVLKGQRRGRRIVQAVRFDSPDGPALDLAWCTFSEPVLSVRGERCPFKYAQQYDGLDAVAGWARAHPECVFENAQKVDAVVGRNNCSKSTNNLLAYTLHSWLLNTWWGTREAGDWFSVWEGSCYFHSTVDVEYTQSPFYLAVWPELLGIELDFWPEFSKDGSLALGARGAGTLFLSHDTGSHSSAGGQDYHHEMEVEETTNYLILALAYWKRTGDASLLHKHADALKRYLRFVFAADTTGNGVPDQGVANTIDDASPAIQFGRCQTYLAVKCLAAFEAGRQFMELFGDASLADECRQRARAVRGLLRERAWVEDHFVTLLEKGGQGVIDPWSGETFDLDEVPGWDAPHIYTANGLVPLDMVGIDLGLDRDRMVTDLVVATERCLREYGCVHTDFEFSRAKMPDAMKGLAGVARNPGWISMNMLRDIAAFYRGVDLRSLTDRYWEWQVVTNSQEPKIFFETFSGNNLCFYPRGVAIWGYFDGLAGLVLNRVDGVDRHAPAFSRLKLPRLFDADWEAGRCRIIG